MPLAPGILATQGPPGRDIAARGRSPSRPPGGLAVRPGIGSGWIEGAGRWTHQPGLGGGGGSPTGSPRGDNQDGGRLRLSV